MIPNPDEVSSGINVNAGTQGSTKWRSDRPLRSGHGPTVQFGVTIGKRETRSAVVKRSREVSPFHLLKFVHEKTVVDRVGMLVEKNEDAAWIGQLRAFEELDIIRIELVDQNARISDQ